MNLRARPVAIGVGVVLAVLIGVLWFAPADPDREGTNPLIGNPAPNVDAATTGGGRIRLADSRGKWVVVNFFATWCTPCLAEHPELVAWSAAAARRGDGQVISVAYDDSPRAIEQFFAERGGDWPVVAEGADRVILDFGVVKLPESFLVDPDGIVVHKFIGGVTRRDIDRAVADAERDGRHASAVGSGPGGGS